MHFAGIYFRELILIFCRFLCFTLISMECQKNLHSAGIYFRETSKNSRISRKLVPVKISTIKVGGRFGYIKRINHNFYLMRGYG